MSNALPLNEDNIINFTEFMLLSKDTMYSLQEIPDPEERARIQAIMEVRAQKLGIDKQFKTVIKQYNNLGDELYGLIMAQVACNRIKLNKDTELDLKGE